MKDLNNALYTNNNEWQSIGTFNKTVDVLVGKGSKINDKYHKYWVAYITPFGEIFEIEKHIDIVSGRYRNLRAIHKNEMGVEIKKTGIQGEKLFDYEDILTNSPMNMVLEHIRKLHQ